MDLFGKKKLEERISELEERISELEEALAAREREKEELVRNLDKKEEKIKRLASANQEANLALKAIEQKLLLKAPTSSSIEKKEEPTSRLQEAWKPGKREFDILLQRLKAIRSPKEDLLVSAFSGSVPEDAVLPPQIRESANEVKSERGRIIIYSPQLFALQLIPPFPIKESASWEGSTFQLGLVEEMMDTPVLVVSAHAGSTFLGVALSPGAFEVKELVESQVKEKHSKGGWSQKRFERLREEDIKNHIDLVLDRLAQMEAKYGIIAKYAVMGGEESLVRQIKDSIHLPLVERKMEKHDEKDIDSLLEEVYGFTCYRIEI